jgi:membrane protein DedA with SNARE-associated domain/rhodanese-related sulfurtransferase
MQTSQFLVSHGLACLFLVILVEQLGLPMPAMPWLLAAGALSATGKLGPVLAILVVVTACLLGDSFWFYLGRRHGAQVLGWLCRISFEPDSCVRRTQNMFTRYGLRGLLVAKFVPGLNTVASPLAGLTGVPFARFVFADAVGSLAYAGCGIGLGYLFSGQLAQIGAALARLGSNALTLLVGLAVLYAAYKYWQRLRLLRELRILRITVGELRQQLESGEPPVILDLRSAAELNLDPAMIRGAIHLEADRLAGYANDMPRDRDIVVYCSCPNEVTSARAARLLQKKGFTRIRPLRGGIDAWRKLDYPLDAWSATVTATGPGKVAAEPDQGA